MRKYVNKALSVFGYELRRLDYFDYFLKKLIAEGVKPSIVQIGAHDGVCFDDLFAVILQHRCRALLVEPLHDAFQKLSTVYSQQPNVTLLRSAVHAHKTQEVLFRVSAAAEQLVPPWARGIASFDKDHLLRHGIDVEHIVEEAVPCGHLMDIIIKNQFGDVNVLQVDVEGYDAAVIGMIDFKVIKPQLIKFESKNLNPTDLVATKDLLANAGYRLYDAAEDTIAWHPR